MQLSETIKLYPTKYQKDLIVDAMAEYIETVNSLVSDAVSGHSIAKITTADVNANLPSALLNQCIRDAKSVVKSIINTVTKQFLKTESLQSVALLSEQKRPICQY